MFAIVEFLETREVGIISKSWLREDNKCFWPPYTSVAKVTKCVQNHAKPQEEWRSYTVRIMYETDNYEKAALKVKKAEETSDLQTQEEDGADNKQAKRKRVPNRRYMSSSSSEEELGPLNLDGRHVVKRKTAAATARTIFAPAPEVPTLPQLPTMLPRSPAHIPSSPGPSHIQSPALRTLDDSLSSPGPSCNQRPGSQRSAVNALDRTYLKLLESVNVKADRIERKLDFVVKKLEMQPGAVGRIPEGVTLPLNTMDHVDATEDILRADENLQSLAAFLSCCGGKDTPHTVRSVMAKLMTDGLAKKFNWQGKGDKRAFSKLRLKAVLLGSVRGHAVCKDAPEEDIKIAAMNWLKTAGDRSGGRREREKRKKGQKDKDAAQAASTVCEDGMVNEDSDVAEQ